MSTWNEEEDGMGFSGLVPSAAEKRAECEAAARIVRENEKLNMAYAEGRKDERDELTRLLGWAYGKLAYRSFDSMEDALAMDEIKLILTGAAS